MTGGAYPAPPLPFGGVNAIVHATSKCLCFLNGQEYQVATATPDDPRFINKVSAGPMVEEDDKYMVGSFFLVSATREEAQSFVDNDPFKKVSNKREVA